MCVCELFSLSAVVVLCRSRSLLVTPRGWLSFGRHMKVWCDCPLSWVRCQCDVTVLSGSNNRCITTTPSHHWQAQVDASWSQNHSRPRYGVMSSHYPHIPPTQRHIASCSVTTHITPHHTSPPDTTSHHHHTTSHPPINTNPVSTQHLLPGKDRE